jgi:3-oxoacyl-[acyl-carrier protein] reductase
VKEEGALHVLVNNAGITRDMLSMRMKDEDWHAVLATNLTAVFRASRAAIRPMMKQRYGRIVNITSVGRRQRQPGAGQLRRGQGRRRRHDALARPRGRQPRHHGQLRRPRLHRDRHDQGASAEAQTAALLAQIPLGRLGQASEIAHAVAFSPRPRPATSPAPSCTSTAAC